MIVFEYENHVIKEVYMSLVVYNTLSKKKELFTSIEDKKVKMYVCGPTVYDFLHIGNFRGAIFFNLVRNWLTELGYEVTYVYNYTDVDDKIIERANERGVETDDITNKYIAEFEKDFNSLGLTKHTHNPRVTHHIDSIISLIEKIIENDKAYVIDGEVFYSVDKFENYGKLSGKNLDDLEAGQRVEVDKRKKNPFDFVLWKPSKEGEPFWNSPWGKGRPGWHIECSAMINTILGDSIDIHGGGIDLIHPHHENEIAQGEGATNKQYCKYWMHNNFINMKDEKMSKSLGNVITARNFLEKWHPEIFKFVMLSSHYRSLLNVTDEKIHQAISGLNRVYSSLIEANNFINNSSSDDSGNKILPELEKAMNEASNKITKALNDDFNTGETFGQIFEVVRTFNSIKWNKKKKDPNAKFSAKEFVNWITNKGALMALFNQSPEIFLKELDEILIREKNIDIEKVEELMNLRASAREDKNFELSDQYRDQLVEMGIELKDSPDGVVWSVKK